MNISTWIKSNAAGPVIARKSLAAAVGVTEPAVRHWANGNRGIPATQVLPIYHATHGAVTPHELRPDLYPDPTWLPPLTQSADQEAA